MVKYPGNHNGRKLFVLYVYHQKLKPMGGCREEKLDTAVSRDDLLKYRRQFYTEVKRKYPFIKKLEYRCFTMLCQFLLHSNVNQPHIYIFPFFLGFLSHLGHCRALSRTPCSIQQDLINCLFYKQSCINTNPNLPIHPIPTPPQYPYICSLCLCLYFCFANKFIQRKCVLRWEYDGK